MSLSQTFSVGYRVEISRHEDDFFTRYTDKDYLCSAREVAKRLKDDGYCLQTRIIEVIERVIDDEY